MREFHRARLLAAGLIATLLLPSLVRAAAMTFPSDSIGRESWQLANGLRRSEERRVGKECRL